MYSPLFLRIITLSCTVLFFSQSLFSQSVDSIAAQSIPEIIVTATRTEKDVNDIGREVTVITNAEIQKTGANTLAALLSDYAGISIIGANQNPGMTQSIFTRGTNSNQTLILIDGVPISDPSSTNNAIDLNELPLSNIEQVEIVRGAHSTLYGSAAIGGAVNIITKKKQQPGFHGNAEVLGGIFGSNTSQLEEKLFLNYTFKNGIYLNLDGINANINGIDATIDTSTVSANFRSFDNDDFDQQRIAAKIGFADKRWNVFGSYSFTNTTADYDKAGYKYRSFDIPTSLYDGDSTRIFTKRIFTTYNVSYKVSDKFDVQMMGGYSTLNRSTVDDSSLIDAEGANDHTFSDGRYEGTEMNHEVLGNYSWADLTLTAGIGGNRETMTSGTHYYNSTYQFELVSDLDSLDLDATLVNAFVQLDIDGSLFTTSLKKLNIIVGARLNHHDLFGSTVVYEINPSYELGNFARLYASYSTGFNAPSLYQLYAPDNYYTSGITRGNPDLKPEYSHAAELGIKFFPGPSINYGFSLYTTIVEHAVEYVYLWDKNVPIDELGQDFYRDDFRGDTYINAGTQHSLGTSAYCTIQLRKWISIDGNISLVNGKQKYSAGNIDTVHTEGNHIQLYSNGAFPVTDVATKGIVRRPSIANAGVTFVPLKNASIRLGGKWTSSYDDIYYDYSLGPYGALNKAPLDNYLLFNLLLRYHLNKNFGASLDIENLLNASYMEIRGFATKGTGIYLTLRGSF